MASPAWKFVVLIAALVAGCLAPEVKDQVGSEVPPARDQGWVMPDIPMVDAVEMLKAHEKFVTTYHYRANNADTHKGAREELTRQFESMGLPVWRQKFTPTDGLAQENICGIKIGTHEPSWWVVVGGHYDTTTTDDGATQGQGLSSRSQGAYDDGSGTWMTVELAREYAKIPSYYSILFCAFDGEERGLEGSGAVFDAMHDDDTRYSQIDMFPYANDGTRGMIDFDMLGIGISNALFRQAEEYRLYPRVVKIALYGSCFTSLSFNNEFNKHGVYDGPCQFSRLYHPIRNI